ncbi:hypothetical protein GOP47_0009442 [Adiantum capillus-veneris]|uniref:Enoyl reductase (ER) domain-containing protein n=1 Tax=Adiantum capillus-veneris TaxID=13818 RepID=A0A9D4UWS7_ADICA|nr:hypothetical protein GOP47_0009442 [Adiantum capillus-veneris]
MENRAICQTQFGEAEPIEVLEFLQRPKPSATPGHAVVKLTARPITPLESFFIHSSFFAPLQKPVVLGSEGAGIVEEIGDNVTKSKAWGPSCGLDVSRVPGFSDEDASQMPINPATVYAMLKDLSVPKGDYLLQTAAASVLGRQLIQLAKHQGIKTINIVRRNEVKEELLALGADEVIDSSSEDVAARVKDITSDKLAYAAVDAVGGRLTKTVGESTRSGGVIYEYGSLSGTGEVVLGLSDLKRNVQLKFWSLFNNEASLIPERRQNIVAELIKLMQEKIITLPPPSKSYPLTEFRQALQHSEKVTGGAKILLI